MLERGMDLRKQLFKAKASKQNYRTQQDGNRNRPCWTAPLDGPPPISAPVPSPETPRDLSQAPVPQSRFYVSPAFSEADFETFFKKDDDTLFGFEPSHRYASETTLRLDNTDTQENPVMTLYPWLAYNRYESGDESDVESQSTSLFAASKRSSADTSVSTSNRQSTTEISTKLLLENGCLKGLVSQTQTAPHIDTNWFFSALRGILQTFAEKLEDEAQDSVEFLAAKVVSLRVNRILSRIFQRYDAIEKQLLSEETLRALELPRDYGNSMDEEFPDNERLIEHLKNSSSMASLIIEVSSLASQLQSTHAEIAKEEIEDILQRASRRANSAVLLDQVQSFEAAVYAYQETCEFLDEAMPHIIDAEKWKSLSSQRSSYIIRIRKIKDGGVLRTSAEYRSNETIQSKEILESAAMNPTDRSVNLLPTGVLASIQQFQPLENKLLRLVIQILSEIGLTEPPLASGSRRFRWRCACGDLLYLDYQEDDQAEIKVLCQEVMHYFFETDHLTPQDDDGSSKPRVPTRFSSLVGSIFRLLGKMGRKDKQQLPFSSRGYPAVQSSASPRQNSASVGLYLLVCVHSSRSCTRLHQESVQDIVSDQALFLRLKELYFQRRGFIQSSMSLRRPVGIEFVEITMMPGLDHYVGINQHAACNGSKCFCLPSEEKVVGSNAEYKCNPIPPRRYPPIPPNLLLHAFSHPLMIDASHTLAFNQFPKKLHQKLVARLDEEAIGWGIYIREGLNWNKVWALMVIAFIGGSLIFSILWTILEHDIQGAFGVASWWLTMCTVVLGYFATRDIV